jgi:hypothetical protein
VNGPSQLNEGKQEWGKTNMARKGSIRVKMGMKIYKRH